MQGHLGPRWDEWFEPLTVTNVARGEAILKGELIDQAALHGMLTKIRDLGLLLLAVWQASATQAGDGAVNDARPEEA